MCKFNLIDVISTSIDPLSGWMEQKASPECWEYPMMAPPILDDVAPPLDPQPGAEGLIPDDLQDLFLDGPSVSGPSLPGGDADSLLDDLLSGPSSPAVFGTLSPLSPLSSSDAGSPACPPEIMDLLPPPALSPDPLLPQQMSLDGWVPTLSPPPSDPFSPPVACEELRGQSAGPDWSPPTLAPPAKRRQARPRPYDKPTRRQVTEQERRERKKEQNKTAATRYRQKKKEEQELACTDQEVLQARNSQLKERVNTLTRELAYLRHLMQEVAKYKHTM
ncbi:activating transcription factor of chaperone-like [Pollicipes pollicipes]|uniref:activating transcription factor of chaperone-like n=1 Tax=Pollicipes pollicipes TaxID=41117 RepID=UPI001884E7AB|nr:activating transcription factor of chaperone-like [Pollicipes pollicipes]